MLSKKEIKILSHLRQDSRQRFISIARKTGLHKLTVSNITKKLQKKGIIKHTALLDFRNMGYSIITSFALKCPQKSRLNDFLFSHPNINSLSAIKGNYDFFAEAVFRNMKEMHDFIEELDTFEIEDMQQIHLIEDIKKEAFMTSNS